MELLSVDNKKIDCFLRYLQARIKQTKFPKVNAFIVEKFLKGQAKNEKMVAILIDPDKSTLNSIKNLCQHPSFEDIDFIFVGGSILTKGEMDVCITHLKSCSNKPILLFPGSNQQISPLADGILLLSLISGRNPELLIGKHVESAFEIKNSGIEILSTSYILIDGGKPTSVSYMSNTNPIPKDKPGIVAATALAGEMLGHSLVYMDAGSGAKNFISQNIISTVRKTVKSPLIVGGGIRDGETLHQLFSAGADVAVIGNHLEDNPEFLEEIVEVKKYCNANLQKVAF
jgi:putative glycerol-1-phosphate prenyltransferase